MSKRKTLTDAGIAAEQRDGAHRRQQWLDNVINSVIIFLILICGLLFACAFARAGLVYIHYIEDPKSVDPKSVEVITSLATHFAALIGGYVLHVVKRATGMKND